MRLTIGLGLLAATMASPALSQNKVLTADAIPELCDSDNLVRPDRLAAAVVNAAGVPFYLIDQANAAGLRNEALQLASENGQSEPLWILRNYSGIVRQGDHEPEPFGPNIRLSTNLIANTAKEAVANLMADEVEAIVEPLRSGAPVANDAPFYATVAGGRSGTGLYAADIFSPEPRVILRCRPTAGTPESRPTETRERGNGPHWTADFRLRGTVADLRRLPADVADGKAAAVGYDLDEIKDTEKLTFNGVASAYFSSPSGEWNIAPFFAYERKDVRDNKDEIETLTPGMLLLWKPGEVPYVDAVGIELSYTWDENQDAELSRLRLSYYPFIRLGERLLFMQGFPFFENHLWVRPEFVVIGDAVSVRDAGTSPILATTEHYFGLGGDLGLSVRLEDMGLLSDFRATVGLRQLHLMGGIDVENSERRYGSIEYNPKEKSWLGIALTFSEGDSDETLQPEDSVALKLTVRR